ncbi:DNA-binding protein [Deltaproteobacteria bacterium]|nr:DNA-binding protein [Deltaproteobacteria bacterium]
MDMDRSPYWLERAEYDLETAKAMLQAGRYLYIGFMCQQTAEKALKAVIAHKGVFPPKIPNLVRLAELADLSDLLSEAQYQLLDELRPLSLEARYPSHKDTLNQMMDEQISRNFIERTEVFLSWIKQML